MLNLERKCWESRVSRLDIEKQGIEEPVSPYELGKEFIFMISWKETNMKPFSRNTFRISKDFIFLGSQG